MAMNPRLLRPRRFGVVGDSDVVNYIAAVEAADGQALEQGVRDAFAAFITGCKADGIWNAIKASCILAGARTLAGALVPLVGTAPTNNNFVSGDYNRETGLLGDGSTKFLNSNRNNNADPQNSKHVSVYASAAGTGGITIGCGSGSDAGRSVLVRFTGQPSSHVFRLHNATASTFGDASELGFLGASRNNGSSFTARLAGGNQDLAQASQTPQDENIGVFARIDGSAPAAERLAFYSIGESLDLALLDARVTALVTAIGAAIP